MSNSITACRLAEGAWQHCHALAHAAGVAVWNPLGDAVKVVLVPAWENTHILITQKWLLTDHTTAHAGRECAIVDIKVAAWQRRNCCGFHNRWAISSPANCLAKIEQCIIAHETDVHAAQEFMQGLALINVRDMLEKRLEVGLQSS
eukprot:CAMPEP_0172819212 /NCGR_PEP_ID=MMETSP1075-20121228/14444_1 /TAXON_ID=2916 /ORGANISM="Ceratium fusus, Strain PA161109" /LENGTH=145 /DNA_ID=CAMNT_0013659697 /DNA_START=119 /DNA_END=557 /DNA_ORIENTATION=-